MRDPAELAKRHEAHLDWEGAAARWRLAEAQGHPDAEEGLERCNKARELIEELCVLAEEDLAKEDLWAATEPL